MIRTTLWYASESNCFRAPLALTLYAELAALAPRSHPVDSVHAFCYRVNTVAFARG